MLSAVGLAPYQQHLSDIGKVRSHREIAAAEGKDLGHVSRIAWLAWVGLGVVEAGHIGNKWLTRSN